MNFSELVELFNELDTTNQRTLLTTYVANYIKKAEGKDLQFSIYLILGNVYSEKTEYTLGIAEKTMINALSQQTGYDSESIKIRLGEIGDLGLVAEELYDKPMQKTLFNTPKVLDLQQLVQKLRAISKIDGEGSTDKKINSLCSLLSNCNSIEAKYLVKIILGNLRFGVSVHTVIDSIAQLYTTTARQKALLERMYMFNSDLGSLAVKVKENGVDKEGTVEPVYHEPIKPMLASRLDYDKIIAKHGGVTYAEWKLDGERVQIHKMRDKIVLYSRQLNDISEQYPDVIKYVENALGTYNCVVEGEIVGYKDGKFLPFQVLMKRKRKHKIKEAMEEVPVRVYIFDILKHSDSDHTNTPYMLRRDVLGRLFQDTEHVFLVPQQECHTTGQLVEFFKDAREKGLEGIIAKSKNGKYAAGKRGDGWIKMKAMEGGKMDDTIDVVVIGGSHGYGRRAGLAGSLLCAVWDTRQNRFVAFTNIGSGFTDEQMIELTDIVNEYTVEMIPPNVFSYVSPDIWVAPQIVLEIVVDEIQVREGKAYAARFPVFKRIRKDKGPRDITTLAEIEDMYRRQTS
jgi:DNA ligase-1